VDDSQQASSSAQHSQSLEAAEDIQVDYSSLKSTVRKVWEPIWKSCFNFYQMENEADIAKLIEKLTKGTKDVEEQLSKMAAPNTKVDGRMDQVKEKEYENQAKLDEGRKEAQKARRNFEKVKNERLKRFQDFFEPVANRIDEIYKVSEQQSVRIKVKFSL